MAAVVSLAGCGSDEGSGSGAATKAAPPPGEGIVTTIAPSGPGDAGTNLQLLVKESNPELDSVQVSCPPPESPPRYPFECELTAADREQGGSVEGVITVHGVYAPTKTYAFAMSYRPRGG